MTPRRRSANCAIWRAAEAMLEHGENAVAAPSLLGLELCQDLPGTDDTLPIDRRFQP
jgi:hypothetical protein